MIAVFRFFQVQQKNEEDKISLHISSSVGSDRGIYVITSTNEMGNDTGVINVVVMGLYSLLCFDCPLVCSVVIIVLIWQILVVFLSVFDRRTDDAPNCIILMTCVFNLCAKRETSHSTVTLNLQGC